jgi:hypothetical protein
MLKKTLIALSIMAFAFSVIGCGSKEGSVAEQGPTAPAGEIPKGDGPKQGDAGPAQATMEPGDGAKDNNVGSKAGGN